MGENRAVDKSRERARIDAYLNGKDFVDFGASPRKPVSTRKGNLQFDKNGKFVGRK